jgi:hypothetical protein
MKYLLKFKNIFHSPEQKFWDWFSDNSEKYYSSSRSDGDLLAELSDKLKKIDKNFCFEMSSPGKDGKRQLVISADGIKSSFPKLVDFVALAPDLEQWEIYAFRQRSKNPDDMQIEVRNIKLNFSDIYFNYELAGDKLDLFVYVKEYDDKNDAYKFAIYIILDSTLGEYDLEMKIGKIKFFKLGDSSKDDLLPLNRLPMIVDNYFKKD